MSIRASLLLASAAVVLSASGAESAYAYTPNSPEVVVMVKDGLKYLEGTKDHEHPGGDALIGMTLYKNGYPASHPRIQRAINRCRTTNVRGESNYSLALRIIFLCEIGPGTHGQRIQSDLAELLKRQARQGSAWTYEGTDAGDTSQTQYGVLAMWTALRAGFDVPVDRIDAACNWLIRTQSTSGGWGYHPRDPGEGDRVGQSDQTLSLGAAGLGSLYVCADMLGLTSAPAEFESRSDLPPALVPVVEPVDRSGVVRLSRSVSPRALNRAQTDGNKWMQSNYSITQNEWPFYYLYALERYHSFRDAAEGRKDDSPFWYNDGVEWLMDTQAGDGSFRASTKTVGESLNTAFAVLFLTRSTRKAIGAASEGVLHGGTQLPSNGSAMSLYGGRIVAADVTRSLGDLLSLLEDQESDDLDDLVSFSPNSIVQIDDPEAYQEQIDKLRKLAGHSTYKVRLVAVRALGQTRDLDNVPTLIYALGDPDVRVAKAADDGLRFISRRFDGFDLPDSANQGDRNEAINKWKQWYLSLRPDAPLLGD